MKEGSSFPSPREEVLVALFRIPGEGLLDLFRAVSMRGKQPVRL